VLSLTAAFAECDGVAVDVVVDFALVNGGGTVKVDVGVETAVVNTAVAEVAPVTPAISDETAGLNCPVIPVSLSQSGSTR
jgi:hypothetical protein